MGYLSDNSVPSGRHSRRQHCHNRIIPAGRGATVGGAVLPVGTTRRPVTDCGHSPVPSSPQHKDGQPQRQQRRVHKDIPIADQLFTDGNVFVVSLISVSSLVYH